MSRLRHLAAGFPPVRPNSSRRLVSMNKLGLGQFYFLVLKISTELQNEASRVRFPMGSLRFFIDIILPAAL